jgi:hypothetical protein
VALERVLITGIAGFVGSTLAEYLHARYPSVQVVGIDRFTDYYPRSIKMANVAALRNTGVQVVAEDLVTTDLDRLLDAVDIVFTRQGSPVFDLHGEILSTPTLTTTSWPRCGCSKPHADSRTSGAFFTHRRLRSMAMRSGTQLWRPTHPIRLAHTR